MDEFLGIDWNPALEDILDSDFVNIDRLQRDSAMYRALKGNLTDPFADLHEDYESMVTKEQVSQAVLESKEKKVASAAGKDPPQEEKPAEATQEGRPYVPGITRTSLKFPKLSVLNCEQQALALKVLLRFSGSEKPSMKAADQEELKTYLALLPAINKEQEAFLEFVKRNWDPSPFEIQEEEFIDFRWKKKVKLIDSLPRYYTELETVPLVSSREIGLNFHAICLEMGIVPKILLPKLTRRFSVFPNTTKMNQRFFSIDTNKGPQEKVIFKTPPSQDPNCETLAKLHDVDLVISSGGLNCLAINIDPNTVKLWILPIVVKRINEKNVVFVDKPLPPTGLNVLQKNAWIHKYNMKACLSHPYHIRATRLDDVDNKSEEEREGPSPDLTKAPEDSCGENTGEMIDEKNDRDSVNGKNNFVPPPKGHNLFYRLFSIGSSADSQNDLIKSRVEKVYKLLVRSKIDGSMKTNADEEHMAVVAAKPEHQLALGAEAVSMEEAAKQWMSLTFRPGTSLVRARIGAKSMELIQFEQRTAISINNEIKRLYGLKTEAALTLLYNVADTMTKMNPGRYIMRHTVRNGAFACVYKEADGPGKNVFDLQTIYGDAEFLTIPNPPWPALDKNVVTPALKIFNRMPAMFHPPRTKNNNKSHVAGKKNQRGAKGGRGQRGGPKRGAGRGQKDEASPPV